MDEPLRDFADMTDDEIDEVLLRVVRELPPDDELLTIEEAFGTET